MRRVELEIMDEIHRICQEHGLTYYLFYGSLLGAKRHGGFIPWDDDIDIVMLREDYEVLAKHFDEWNCVDRFSLAWYRDGSAANAYMKVCDTTTYVEEAFNRADFATGVWVDIFPLDNYDREACAGPVRKMRSLSLWRSFIITNPCVASNSAVALAKKVVCPLVKSQDPKRLSCQIDNEAKTMCTYKTGKLVDALGGEWNVVFDLDMFQPEPVQFEDRTYISVKDYDRVLSCCYGDWQTPPPENDREMHTADVYFL